MHLPIFITTNRATYQVVSHWLVIAKAQVQCLGSPIWGLWWTNCIGAVSHRTFRFFPVSYRPTNASYSLSPSDTKRPTTHHDGHGAQYPHHTVTTVLPTTTDRTTLNTAVLVTGKPSPPAPQTLQSAINITCEIFILVDASHGYLPTRVLQAILTETRNRVEIQQFMMTL